MTPPAPANDPRRRPALTPRRELVERYGIDPSQEDHPREVVHVDHIPTPPLVEAPNTARPTQARLTLEDTVAAVLRDEFDDLAVRLERYGVALSPSQQQDLIDYSMALLAGAVSGGATARR